MSELETAGLPSRAAIMSMIGTLEGLRPTAAPAAPTAPPAPSSPAESSPPPHAPSQARAPVVVTDQAAQARHDQVATALREMTAERDAWRAEATTLRDALTEHLDALRAELAQHLASTAALRGEVDRYRAELDGMRTETKSRDEQIAHLSTAMTAVIQLARTRLEAAPGATAQRPEPAHPDSSVAGSGLSAPATGTDALPMAIPSLAPDRAPVEDKPRLGVGRVKLVANPPTTRRPPEAG